MLPWSPSQHRSVEQTLLEHPASSGRCAIAARAILPPAAALDSRATALLIQPMEGEGIYLETARPYGGSPWFHHVTVETLAHRVDAMTGADGHDAADYLTTFFHHASVLSVRPVAEDDWEYL